MKRRPLSKLAGLTPDQLSTLAGWLFDETVTYNAITERCKATFNTDVDRTTLWRQRKRLIEDGYNTAPNADLAAEILQYSTRGAHKFSEAVMALLEKSAFELALLNNQTKLDEDDSARIFTRLRAVFLMLLQHRRTVNQETNADTSRRNVAVREQLATLNREKFEYRTGQSSPPPADSIRHSGQTSPMTAESPCEPPIPTGISSENPPIFLQFPPNSSNRANHDDQPGTPPLATMECSHRQSGEGWPMR